MHPREGNGNSIAEMAAQWLARRDRGLLPDEEVELQRWLAGDPRHAAELANLEAAWHDFDQAKLDPDISAMASDLDRATALRPRTRPLAWKGLLVAAAAAVALASGYLWRRSAVSNAEHRVQPEIATTYQVLASTARSIALEDGSVAELRGDSEIRATFSGAERRVELLHGEAHFTVARDPSRPFIVSAGDAAVHAIGTAFNVRMAPDRVEVLVTEGEVQVQDVGQTATDKLMPSSVVAGQRAVLVRPAGGDIAGWQRKLEITVTAPAEMDHELAWRSVRLVFNRTPLADAVQAFNRHSSAAGIRIEIGDAALRTRLMGGTFRAANVEAFVRLLEQSAEIRAERRDGEIVLFPER